MIISDKMTDERTMNKDYSSLTPEEKKPDFSLTAHTNYTENSEFLPYIPKLTHSEFQKMKMCQI